MASKKLEWILSLVDRMSGPAGDAGKKLADLEKRMRAVDRATMAERLNKTADPLKRQSLGLQIEKSLVGEQKRAADASGEWIAKLNHGLGVVQMIGGALAGAARVAVGLAETTGRILYGFTSAAVEAASFKEQNLIAFRTILGTDAAAERMMKTLVDFAAVTPFETKQIMEMGKNLLVGGFKEQEIPIVLKAVGDVGAMKGFSQEVIDRIVSAMGQVKARGKLTGEAMMRFAEAGLPAGKVYEKLGQTLGVTAQQAQKMMSAGRISADTGIFAVVKTIRDDMSGGKLGGMMDQMSQTVQGLWSTLSSKPFEYMMDLNKSGGFAALKGVLGNVLGVLDRHQPRIKAALERVFTGTINAVFGDLAGGEGTQKIEAFVERVTNVLEAMPSAISGFFAGLSAGAGGLFGDLGKLFDGPMTPDKLKQIETSFAKFGRTLGEVASSAATLAGYLGTVYDVLKFIWKFTGPGMLVDAAGVAGKLAGQAWGKTQQFNERAVGLASGRGYNTEMEAWGAGAYTPGPSLQQVAGGRNTKIDAPITNVINVTGADAADPQAIGREVGKATTEATTEWEKMMISMGVGT